MATESEGSGKGGGKGGAGPTGQCVSERGSASGFPATPLDHVTYPASFLSAFLEASTCLCPSRRPHYFLFYFTVCPVGCEALLYLRTCWSGAWERSRSNERQRKSSGEVSRREARCEVDASRSASVAPHSGTAPLDIVVAVLFGVLISVFAD